MSRLNVPRFLLLASVLLLAGHFLPAQPHQFRFFPIKGIAFEQQGLIGIIGKHAFLLNLEKRDQLSLFVYDTAQQSGTGFSYAFEQKGMTIVNRANSLFFVGTHAAKQRVSIHFLEIDGKGSFRDADIDIASAAITPPARTAVSADKLNVLVYSIERKNSDSALIRGVIFDSALAQRKQLNYSFRYDADLEMEPEVILDNFSNTHVVVYDKTTNYRLSSDLTLNTIPFAEEQIISETFNFNKIKLKTLQVFQNAACNCIQAEGLYVDGMEKNNRGIYSVAFPFGRKNELAPRFIRFRPHMIQQFRRGFSATEEAVQENMQLQEIFYSDSGSLAVFRLQLGEPQKLLPEPVNSESRLGQKSVHQSLAISRANEMVMPAAQTTTPGTRTRGNARTVPLSDPNSDLWGFVSGSYKRPPLLTSRASGRNAPKLLFVKLGKDQGFEWFTSRPLDLFSTSADFYNKQFIAGGPMQEVAMIMYQADAADEPVPVLVTVSNGRQLVERFAEKQLVFSPLQVILPGQYGALYLNLEKNEGGIMLILPKQ